MGGKRKGEKGKEAGKEWIVRGKRERECYREVYYVERQCGGRKAEKRCPGENWERDG